MNVQQQWKYTTLTAKDVNQFLGRWRVRCSSTIARRGENNRRAFSIATALEGKTTTFLYKEWNKMSQKCSLENRTGEAWAWRIFYGYGSRKEEKLWFFLFSTKLHYWLYHTVNSDMIVTQYIKKTNYLRHLVFQKVRPWSTWMKA